eukprot:NODE_1181_length_1249_cov_71.408333_g890_i1.p1 GENE.NODE_1181_length_1249_cov_71.408333_g890_i1~~NODE_1181_length_1249_cov_71.408333_g890_i1.p1  ORF type:complete len:278 (-),score=65.09 NODE_1181_length_1249_cov_71.408333_g890_i1:163-996(-)
MERLSKLRTRLVLEFKANQVRAKALVKSIRAENAPSIFGFTPSSNHGEHAAEINIFVQHHPDILADTLRSLCEMDIDVINATHDMHSNEYDYITLFGIDKQHSNHVQEDIAEKLLESMKKKVPSAHLSVRLFAVSVGDIPTSSCLSMRERDMSTKPTVVSTNIELPAVRVARTRPPDPEQLHQALKELKELRALAGLGPREEPAKEPVPGSSMMTVQSLADIIHQSSNPSQLLRHRAATARNLALMSMPAANSMSQIEISLPNPLDSPGRGSDSHLM